MRQNPRTGLEGKNIDSQTIHICREIYRLLENLGLKKNATTHPEYAANALHLLRDAVVDTRALYSLAESVARRRQELEQEQVSLRTFHGPLHDQYHDAARQLRAAIGSGLTQSKRVLNQTADVVDSFVHHGVRLRSRSFGSQVESVTKMEWSTETDARTARLLDLIKIEGTPLERHNSFRDKFIEHSHARRTGKQPRPMNSRSSILAFAEANDGLHSLNYEIEEVGFNYVMISDRSKVKARSMVAVHLIPGVDSSDGSKLLIRDERMVGHFMSNDPHSHWFEIHNDDKARDEWEQGISVVRTSDLARVQSEVLDYVEHLVAICLAE